MRGEVADTVTRTTDYRLNQLGVRVTKGTCQLISRIGGTWFPMGPRWQIPIRVPATDGEMAYAHAVSVTAYQYCTAFPDTELRAVLTGDPQAKPRQPSSEEPLLDRLARARSPLPTSPRKAAATDFFDLLMHSRELLLRSWGLLDKPRREAFLKLVPMVPSAPP